MDCLYGQGSQTIYNKTLTIQEIRKIQVEINHSCYSTPPNLPTNTNTTLGRIIYIISPSKLKDISNLLLLDL